MVQISMLFQYIINEKDKKDNDVIMGHDMILRYKNEKYDKEII